MMNIKSHIPNAITCINVVAGCFAINFCFQQRWEYVAYAVLIAMLADFADGFVARMLKVTSQIGKELDSLADAITFGLLPGMLMFQVMKLASCKGECTGLLSQEYYPYLAFLIPVFSVIRLAKFNVDTEQGYYFKGLNTPASTAFFVSLTFVYLDYELHPKIILVCVFIVSYLMVSDIKLIALKFQGFAFKDNWEKYLLVIISVILVFVFKFQAFFAIIPFYIFFSVFIMFLKRKTDS